jgi:N-acetylglucosamine kinase-like BadF-type ATPase
MAVTRPAGGPALPAVLAIDGGNSKTDVALISADGTVLARERGPGANAQHHGDDEAMRRIGALVRAAAHAAGLTPPAGRTRVAGYTAACLAGADLPDEEEHLADLVRAQGWSADSTVVNDTFAVLRAGLDGHAGPDGRLLAVPQPGIAVTCGAGINCVGVAPDGRVTRFLSLGVISGDFGGGRDLGFAALWSAARAEDGRGPQTRLREDVAGHFGVPRVRDVIIALRGRRGGPGDGAVAGGRSRHHGGDRGPPPGPGRHAAPADPRRQCAERR